MTATLSRCSAGGSLLSLAAVPVLAVLGVVQWWVGLAPVLMVVAGYVALVGALSHPTAAAGLALRGVPPAERHVPRARARPPPADERRDPPGVALAILALPCAGRRPRRGPPDARAAPPEPSTRPSLLVVGCAAIGGVVMIVVALLVGRGDPFAFVAWTASGDARFHLLFVRDVLAEGGLHGQAFTYQPQYQEALTALLADTHGRGGARARGAPRARPARPRPGQHRADGDVEPGDHGAAARVRAAEGPYAGRGRRRRVPAPADRDRPRRGAPRRLPAGPAARPAAPGHGHLARLAAGRRRGTERSRGSSASPRRPCPCSPSRGRPSPSWPAVPRYRRGGAASARPAAALVPSGWR